MSYIDSPYEKRAGAHRQDLLREAGQQRMLAHLPQYASSCEVKREIGLSFENRL